MKLLDVDRKKMISFGRLEFYSVTYIVCSYHMHNFRLLARSGTIITLAIGLYSLGIPSLGATSMNYRFKI
jgi:hypothetical protein